MFGSLFCYLIPILGGDQPPRTPNPQPFPPTPYPNPIPQADNLIDFYQNVINDRWVLAEPDRLLISF